MADTIETKTTTLKSDGTVVEETVTTAVPKPVAVPQLTVGSDVYTTVSGIISRNGAPIGKVEVDKIVWDVEPSAEVMSWAADAVKK